MSEPDHNLKDEPTQASEAPAEEQPLPVDSALAQVAAARAVVQPAFVGAPASGRRYGFLCSYCSSRLEATDSMAAQPGTCPTCGNKIVIPILDSRGRLIDPTTNEVIKQDPHPVHAYAAAGHRAPQIVELENGRGHAIVCPRCTRQNPLTSNNCVACGLPFTMDGTVGEGVSGSNTWAVAALVLGIVGIPTFCLVVPALLAVIFGILAMRGSNTSVGPQAGRGMAIAGIIMGLLSTAIMLLFYARLLHM